MVLSSRIKSKLNGKQNDPFTWLEEKVDHKRQRRASPGRRYYKGFKLNSLTVNEGDCVLIKISSSKDAPGDFEVARVLQCFHDGLSEQDSRRIVVQWYTQIDKVRRNHLKFIPKGLPPLDGDLEVVKDMWGYEANIDLETVAALCNVIEVPATVQPDSIERPDGAVGPLYICRFSYSKVNPYVKVLEENVDVGTEDKTKIDKKLALNASSSCKVEVKEIPEVSMRKLSVKRKLIELSPEEENKFNKRSKSLNENFTSSIKSLSFEFEPQTNLDSKTSNQNITVNKSDNIISRNTSRGLRVTEITDLLDDDEHGKVKSKENAKTKCQSKKQTQFSPKTVASKVIIPSKPKNEAKSKLPWKSPRKSYRNENEIKEITKSPKLKAFREKESHIKRLSNEENRSPLKRSTRDNLTPLKKIPYRGNEASPLKTLNRGSKESPFKTVHTKKEKKSPLVKKEGSLKTASSKKKKETPLKGKFTKGQREIKLPVRNSSINESDTEFQLAKAQLHVSSIPSYLPCRENEYEQIYSFVEGKLLDSTGGCMYISGVPGTGKTATVREVVRHLCKSEKEGVLPSFDYLEVNAMTLTKPHQLWVQMWEGLTGQRVTVDHASALLRKMLMTEPKRKSIFLLLDELDLLWTRKQDVMYNLFDWSSQITSKLIVVAIANTMDLPERMMMNRVSSRLGLTRMTFHPYTFQQLQEIIASRLEGIKAFDPDAIQLVARKVAAVSGDARRALDVCRRATEIAELEKVNKSSKSPLKAAVLVGMAHVSEAINEMFSSSKIMAIRRCSQMEKYVLKAVLLEFTRIGIEEAVLNVVYEHLQSLCRLEGISPPTSSVILFLINRLSAQRILFTDHSRQDLILRLRLNISIDDVNFALSI